MAFFLHGIEEQKVPIIFSHPREGEKLYEELSNSSENLVKSEYDKLLILKKNRETLKENQLETMIEEFRSAAESYDKKEIKSLLKKYINEYEPGQNE